MGDDYASLQRSLGAWPFRFGASLEGELTNERAIKAKPISNG